ncbi:hypothetical protein FAVG1_07634 [Fusarium avenaceum]|nr:hypothetical protein FAVG1_07634 [Fusarium avenaceum]
MFQHPTRESAAIIASKEATFPDGITTWHTPTDASVDICFVHGLSGDRDKTWTGGTSSEPWPAVILPSLLPNARLMTFGYDAYAVGKPVASTNRLEDHANSLLKDLSDVRNSTSSTTRRLIFVAHSFGGIVCKAAMIKSQNSPENHFREIFNSVTSIAFMGTPHRGSWIANWAKTPARALGYVKSTSTNLLQVLSTDNEYLDYIGVTFLEMLRALSKGGREIRITCFFEELPMRGYGCIVSRESATFAGYQSVSIHGNHSNMVKFASPEDNGFKRLLGELKRWEQPDTSFGLEHARSDETATDPRQVAGAKPTPPTSSTTTGIPTGRTDDNPGRERTPGPASFSQSGGSGAQFYMAPGALNNTGSGNIFNGGEFSGPFTFGSR